MEWSNIRMSKAEFERLQKEYAEAAISCLLYTSDAADE